MLLRVSQLCVFKQFVRFYELFLLAPSMSADLCKANTFSNVNNLRSEGRVVVTDLEATIMINETVAEESCSCAYSVYKPICSNKDDYKKSISCHVSAGDF